MIELKNKTEIETLKPDLVDVFYKNDNKTTFDFVIFSLMNIFKHSYEESVDIATEIHNKGEGIVAKHMLKEIALTKINQVKSMAKKEGFPLEVFFKDI